MGIAPPVGFGICGLGFMGRTYFRHLRGHPHARVVAVYDPSPAKRAGEWGEGGGNLGDVAGGRVSMDGIRTYDTFDKLLADPGVHVAAITLPTPLHRSCTVEALRAGKHVICEKPMSLRLPDCDAMVEAARQTGHTLMIGQCIRFWPQYEAIQQKVVQGAIGKVRFMTLRRLTAIPAYSSRGWLMDHRQSGGALFDFHVHDVDFVQQVLGPPAVIQAAGALGPSGGFDHVMALYRYGEGRDSEGTPGCYVTLECGWVFHPPWPFVMAITVVGETGTLHWNINEGPDVLHFTGGGSPDRNEPPARIRCPDENGWQRELDYFIGCLLEDRPVSRCLPESSRLSIGLTLLEKRAIQTGRTIRVPPCIADRDGCKQRASSGPRTPERKAP